MHHQFLKALAHLSLQRRLAIGAVLLCAVALALRASTIVDLSTFLLNRQDRWLLLAQAVILIVIGERLRGRSRPLEIPRSGLIATAVIVVGFCYFGHYLVLSGYDLSRDEQMAVFDAEIFSSGRLVQPLPAFWQQHAAALNTLFMLPVERPVAWVSAYLPVNSLLRAVVGMVVDPAFTAPILTAIGLLALYKCARSLWPEDREAPAIACLFYLSSGQVLFAGMTAYAMPAHLTFNLVWLWLFLASSWQADMAALVIGFAATGLHQPLFHPLFVLPFMLLLVRDRAWTRLVYYGIGYAIICGFWLVWPIWIHGQIAGPNSITATAGTDYWSRLKLALADTADARWTDMAANVLRFAAWQNMLLVPFMLMGAALARRHCMALVFLANILIPLGLMALILPFQGYGFGYRYLHGALGSVILLAVYGWRQLAAQQEQNQARSLIVRSIVTTAALVLPLQLWMAHRNYVVFSSVEQRVATSGTDYFAVGGADTSFSGDLVINRPDLSNRPIRFYAEVLRKPFIRKICASTPRIGLPTTRLFGPIDSYFLASPDPIADRRIASLKPVLQAAGCSVIIIDAPAVDRF